LARIESEESMKGLRHHTQKVQQQLVHLPEIECSLRAFTTLEQRLRALDEALKAVLEAESDVLVKHSGFDALADELWSGIRAAGRTDQKCEARPETQKEQRATLATRHKTAEVHVRSAALRDARLAHQAATLCEEQAKANRDAVRRDVAAIEATEHLLQARK